MFSDNVRQSINPEDHIKEVTVDLYKLTGTCVFCGIGGFAYEAAGTIFTGRMSLPVKESMDKPLKIRKILILTFMFIGTLFFLISSSFYHVGHAHQGLRQRRARSSGV
jgi:hypothetical protein